MTASRSCAKSTRIREGTLYYTDEWQAHATLKLRGAQVLSRKEKGRPVGRDHIDGIEGWRHAKNWLCPYRGVPRRYFLYLAEFAVATIIGMKV